MSSARRHYFYSGLHIDSEWAIDQWAAFEQPYPVPPDLTIRSGEPDYQVEAEDYLHEVPTVACFVLRGGREVVVIKEGGVEPDLVNVYLTATVWGAVCYQRGLHLLHGSAIRVKGKAFVFSGHSGAGKSTLAAWMTMRGYETICDDTCRLETIDHQVCIYPSARRFKLWGESIRALGWESNAFEQETPEVDKFQLPMPGDAIVDPQPLAAVYFMGWGELRLVRLKGAEAVRAFLESATYRPEFLDPLDRRQEFIQSVIQVASRVPVYNLFRPHDLSAMDNTIEMLERHWNDEYPQT
jgi:hypothetical protein